MRKILLAPFVGLVVLAGCGNSSDRVTVASKDQPGTVVTAPPQESTTTMPPSTVTTLAPPTSSTTGPTTSTTRQVPSTTTTARPATTTTTRPPARTITVVATPGQYATDVLVKGAGCAGPEYGVTLEIRDPSGQAVDGDGGLAAPDGTWELHEHFGSSRPAGQYSFHAKCTVTNGPTVFEYAPQTMTWAG